jgi:hypothetical protein
MNYKNEQKIMFLFWILFPPIHEMTNANLFVENCGKTPKRMIAYLNSTKEFLDGEEIPSEEEASQKGFK